MAWLPLGWHCAWVSEVDKFCCKVLKHHYPETVNHGDFTNIRTAEPVDVLVGGTPCQSFSVAGKRAGLDDPRGNITLEYFALAGRLRPRWLVWENVPGVLSDDGGRTFGAVLGTLGQLGYGFAYRLPDAQYFGLAQQRERLFVVGYLGDWRPAAAVLLDRTSLSGNPPPRRQAGQGLTHDIAPCLGNSGRGFERTGETRGQDPVVAFGGNNTAGPIDVATACNAHGGSGRMDFESETFVAHTLRAEGYDASEDGTGRGAPLAPWLPQGYRIQRADGVADTVTNNPAGGTRINPVLAFNARQDPINGEVSGMSVRRLTARECERLQGFSDDYTLIPEYRKPAKERGADAEMLLRYYHRTERGRAFVELKDGRVLATPDGQRYRALGNSMAVPCMRWIGERIAAVDK